MAFFTCSQGRLESKSLPGFPSNVDQQDKYRSPKAKPQRNQLIHSWLTLADIICNVQFHLRTLVAYISRQRQLIEPWAGIAVLSSSSSQSVRLAIFLRVSGST
jgi:hypothetical protein